MASLTPALAAEFIEDAANLLGEAGSLTGGDRGEYIRDGNPENLFDAVPLALARQGCRRYADNPGNPTAARQARVERACRPYLDSLEYGEPPSLELPFRGGQCVGVGYNADFTYTNDQGTRVTFGFDFPGGGLVGTYIGNQQFNGLYPIGVERLLSGSVVRLNVASVANSNGGNPAIENIRRQDGLPDNCGNPIPEYEPPKPPPLPGPKREPFTIAPNVDIDIDVEVNPDLTFDIDIGTGPITIDPFGDGGGDGGGGDGGGGDGPLPPGFQGEPDLPIDVAPGDAADETANRNLVGVLVQVIETPPRVNRLFNPTESYDKGCYYVYFGGDGGLSINPDAALVRTDQFFYAPPGCNRFRVIPNNGFTLRVTPYYEED